MNKLENFNSGIDNQKIWKQDEIFDTISNDKINKFFESYKQFDELGLCVTKEKSSLIYSEHILLDWEVSWKLYSDFYDTFLDSIKSIVGEDLFIRLWTFFEEKDYLLSNEHKKSDSDPYLDDKFQVILLWDDTVAQFIERRNTYNNVEFHYIVYPNRIFSFIDNLCKQHNIKI